MKFKSEDEAFETYLEYVQANMPFDISEWDHDFSEGFYDWLDVNRVVIEGDDR